MDYILVLLAVGLLTCILPLTAIAYPGACFLLAMTDDETVDGTLDERMKHHSPVALVIVLVLCFTAELSVVLMTVLLLTN